MVILNYMEDPRAKTVGGFIAALEILAKYLEEGTDTKYFINAEHDCLYSDVSDKDCPEDSEDGCLLTALGWHIDEECWAYFT